MKLNGISVIRFVNNEEIIGEVTRTGDNVTVNRPAILHIISDEQSRGVNVALVPYAPYANQVDFQFSLSHIITAFDPDPRMIANYNSLLNPPPEVTEGSEPEAAEGSNVIDLTPKAE